MNEEGIPQWQRRDYKNEAQTELPECIVSYASLDYLITWLTQEVYFFQLEVAVGRPRPT